MQKKKQSMQQFYIDFGNYLETNGHQLNGDRSYQTIRGVIEQIIDSNPEVYNIGGASSKSKMKTLFKTDYKVFKNNLIALFDDKANGELKGELYTPKKKNKGRKRRSRRTKKPPRRTKRKSRRAKRKSRKTNSRSI